MHHHCHGFPLQLTILLRCKGSIHEYKSYGFVLYIFSFNLFTYGLVKYMNMNIGLSPPQQRVHYYDFQKPFYNHPTCDLIPTLESFEPLNWERILTLQYVRRRLILSPDSDLRFVLQPQTNHSCQNTS